MKTTSKRNIKSVDDPGGQGMASRNWGGILVAWYRRSHRKLPWRAEPGQCHDPYRTWLSEIMLQQTTVVTVIPYYQKFLDRWPTVQALARADEADVLREWAGLGYYARGRNLLKGARAVVSEYAGEFPADVTALQKIPGIGPYTASAVGAMAFGLRTVPVDGNVERVLARVYRLDQPVAAIKPRLRALAQSVLEAGAPHLFSGDLAQAFMDLGATVCTPKSPKCAVCPLRSVCAAHAAGHPEQYPVALPKPDKPVRRGQVFLIQNKSGKYGVVRRGAHGLLAGMLAFPTQGWDGNADAEIPKFSDHCLLGQVRHSFTHFNLILDVVHGKTASRILKGSGMWYDVDDLRTIGLPKVFLKAVGFLEKGSK